MAKKANGWYTHKPQGPEERKYLAKLYAFRGKIQREAKRGGNRG